MSAAPPTRPNASRAATGVSGTMPGMTTLAVIEDDRTYRTLLEEIAQRSGRYRLVGSFETAESAVRALRRRPADVAVVDIQLPGQSGVEFIAQVRTHCPAMRCLVVTGSGKTETLFSALEAGACGYLLKSDSPAQILAGLDEVVAGGAPLSRPIARHVLAAFGRKKKQDYGVSRREAQIVDALASGFTYKEIGGKLGISASTVKNHLYRIYGKLGVRSRTEAVVKWLKR